MATTPQVSDQDRKRFEQALLAALVAVYLGRMQTELDRQPGGQQAELSEEAASTLSVFVLDRAGKVQDGINQYFSSAVDALPDGASEEDQAKALSDAAREIEEYNAQTLQPYLTSYSEQQATLDAWANHDGLWDWTQNSDFPDECEEADAESPASLEDLMGIAGGPPPVHENCMCELSPVK